MKKILLDKWADFVINLCINDEILFDEYQCIDNQIKANILGLVKDELIFLDEVK